MHWQAEIHPWASPTANLPVTFFSPVLTGSGSTGLLVASLPVKAP